MNNSVIGRVHSIQSLGTVDGPGVRFVVFLQGCNLRCGCCHNPDTWQTDGGTLYSAEDIFNKAVRYKEYFGNEGGITISGGEPLLQPEFVRAVFELCRSESINTCLDTSGSILNDDIKNMLDFADRVLLDIKYTNDSQYREHVGCSIEKPLEFLSYLQSINMPVTIRQVIIPTLNDNIKSIQKLAMITSEHSCVDKIELLPFKKICQMKYDNLNLPFKFASLPEPKREDMVRLEQILNA